MWCFWLSMCYLEESSRVLGQHFLWEVTRLSEIACLSVCGVFIKTRKWTRNYGVNSFCRFCGAAPCKQLQVNGVLWWWSTLQVNSFCGSCCDTASCNCTMNVRVDDNVVRILSTGQHHLPVMLWQSIMQLPCCVCVGDNAVVILSTGQHFLPVMFWPSIM